MAEKWLTNILGNCEDCTAGMCGACCVWPAINEPFFKKPPYTPCRELDLKTLLCCKWPDPPCGKKEWTCRQDVNKYSDPGVYRGELNQQRLENIHRKWRLLKNEQKGNIENK